MARFISLTLATLLSMAVFAQAAPTGAASTTDINGQVPQQEAPNGGTDIAAPSGPNKRSNGQTPEEEGQAQNGEATIAEPNGPNKRSNNGQIPQQNGGSITAPNGANKRSNDISTNQPATAGTTTGKQKTKQTEKRSTTGSSNGPDVDENTNVPEKRSSENDLPKDAENQVKEQEEKRSASAHQSESGNASGGKKSIGKRCNKDVTGAADQGQPPVSVGGQEGAATTVAGDQQDGALDGLTKRSDNEIKDKTQHQTRDDNGAAFGGTAGHGQEGKKVEKRHNMGKKNNGKNKQNNGAQTQGTQPGQQAQPGQPGQAAANPQ
ncbi:predicted protein [Lichtheimia corymbifera JMRC:FSU:9682]|uniref:Uncharacterized protein n=1 Tax=Lichtheimia corymbifera JMRC:FSU:9682 TaxID=1263082 RepID=A0A068SEV1_9FUNG|nr:predicted protein [Lichtheimia corymbifera JMRC:FSU:9682]